MVNGTSLAIRCCRYRYKIHSKIFKKMPKGYFYITVPFTRLKLVQSGVADPWHFRTDPVLHLWLTDLDSGPDPSPDPATFVSYHQDGNGRKTFEKM